MTKQVLVTGASGFAGRYMCAYLAALEERPRIIGADVSPAGQNLCDAFCTIDVSSAAETAAVIEETRPDYIIHLAGRFHADDLQEMYRANVLSLTALLEAVRQFTPTTVIVAAGSAAECGRPGPQQLPVTEETPCQPVTPYGLTKMLATQVASYYHRAHDITTMIVRPFQLIGRGVPTTLAPGAFAEQLQRAQRDGLDTIRVGNLDAYRDFLDVRDAVRAIGMLCDKPAAGERFSLCSGQPTRMRDLLQLMIEACGVNVKVEIDATRLRGRAEVPRIYGSFQKLKSHCGWQPTIGLDQSVRDMFQP